MSHFLRILNTLLLASILATLVLILLRIPPALTEPVSVTISNSPLDVEVTNTPSVEVDGPIQIYR